LSALGGRLNANLYALANGTNSQLYFNDIVTGSELAGGPNGPPVNTASVGYDLSTGLGTPRATNLISGLSDKSVDAPFILSSFGWEGDFFNVPSATDSTTPEPIGGTGSISGGSKVQLTFQSEAQTFQPINGANNHALDEILNADGVTPFLELFRTPSGRIYGDGFAIVNADTGNVISGPIKVEGQITTDADGTEHVSGDFFAVDSLGNEIPKSPFIRGTSTSEFFGLASFKGTFSS